MSKFSDGFEEVSIRPLSLAKQPERRVSFHDLISCLCMNHRSFRQIIPRLTSRTLSWVGAGGGGLT